MLPPYFLFKEMTDTHDLCIDCKTLAEIREKQMAG